MKLPFLMLALVCILAAGCSSIPRRDNCGQLYSFTREEKKVKRKFAGKSKIVSIKDFRGVEAYDEDISELKARVEEYISAHPDLNETAKNNLREIKVTAGSTKEQVILLLGQPDRITKKEDKSGGPSEVWIYKTGVRSDFTVGIIPVFSGHEKYYLYFKDGILASIERHYLEQSCYSTDLNMGVQKPR